LNGGAVRARDSGDSIRSIAATIDARSAGTARTTNAADAAPNCSRIDERSAA
jgi:hypothetical protein